MKKTLLALSILIISGCTTDAVNHQSAKPVPTDRILSNTSGSSSVVITRDKGWMAGGGCYVTVLIDGKPSARMDTGESIKFNVSEGRHILGISGDNEGKGLCGLKIGQPLKETSTIINSSEIQYFRITGDTNTGLDLRPSSN